MTDDDLERRIRRLEDIEALRTLKHRYATYCDDGYDAGRLAPLFTDDAIWDGGDSSADQRHPRDRRRSSVGGLVSVGADRIRKRQPGPLDGGAL